MNHESSGLLGIAGVIGAVILYFVLRRYMPSLANILLFLVGIIMVCVLLLVVGVMYLSLRKPKKTEEQKASDELAAVLNQGKRNLMNLRRMSMEIKDSGIRSESTEICGSIDKILRTLKERPDRIASQRQFFNYYLPTLEKILLKFKELESGGVLTEQITESTKICLEDIKTAMSKQYNNLFENDLLDLTVDMEALTYICKKDGLLTEEDFI